MTWLAFGGLVVLVDVIIIIYTIIIIIILGIALLEIWITLVCWVIINKNMIVNHIHIHVTNIIEISQCVGVVVLH